ncbi:methyltransferase type 12 [Sandaracinobacteroides saxicola]|uniref:Methyltransferase type 12 n=1 Tax=Sandaracinobacteroides saxicola TaxID=2759707 RepID=A0A7G5IJ68_9SPHN|nr:methyltransferase type 12 [Sandaracinobacteroides saxicola]QMW23410.1 methyltransferase type 12 [Sandaracinobacteroides saxicola]
MSLMSLEMERDETVELPEPDRVDWAARTRALLDHWHGVARDSAFGPEFAGVVPALARARALAGPAWMETVLPMLRAHPLQALVRNCPIVDHSVRKPRGYAGDAALLDLIYQHPSAPLRPGNELGQRLTLHIASGAASRSVRYRRLLLAEAIDDAALRHDGARVMSLACGHMREVEWSLALAHGGVRELLAADQDAESLARVAADYGARFPMVRPTALSVKQVIRGAVPGEGGFDLVYAAGLYDYLPAAVARALTKRLFGLLRPGGRLLLGNFGDDFDGIAFTESLMHWPLLWRTPVQIEAFANDIPAGAMATRRVFADPTHTCWYLDLTRA